MVSFSPGQLAMTGLHKGRYMKPASSDSDDKTMKLHAPDSADDFEQARADTIKMLVNYKLDSTIDHRLWEQVVLSEKDEKNMS